MFLLQRVYEEFDNLSRLDSPESVNPNEKLWEEVSNKIEEFKTLLKNENLV